ncbi:MAG: hypothetical protein MUF87_19210 [Anaerolineae bacterium]|jgi:hypothetical protein|nr:hypothetical protein [Anaerolineae bacterium]
MSVHNLEIIGRVLRASTRGFCCGTNSANINQRHDFGAFVKVPITNDDHQWVIGLIYAVEIKDDLMISELVMAESVDPNVLRDQRANRMIPVEVSVLNIGYYDGDRFFHSLPPRPPMSLSEVSLCTSEEIATFTQRSEYLRLILQASEVPSDDLVAMALRFASLCYPGQEDRRAFMIHNGRQLARLLSNDLKRLSHILTLIRP